MIRIENQIAAADGLAGSDRMLVRELAEAWRTHADRNLLRHQYYIMHNPLVDLGISVPPELTRINAACGWAKKCVDVMVEHSKFNGFTAKDADIQAILDGVYRRNSLKSRYPMAATSAMEQCFSLWLVTSQSEKRSGQARARVSVYPAHVCGCVWNKPEGRLGAAMLVVDTLRERGRVTDEPSWVDVVTDEALIRIKRASRTDPWRAGYVPHSLGRVPAFVMPYEPTLLRPFGSSRITREVMGYIDSAMRENLNEEVASALASSTQKYLLGTDGDPFTNRTRWDAYIGSIFNIDMTNDGTVPVFGQLAQPSMQPLVDHFRMLCGKMSAATGVHVSQFGAVHDQPASSDAIYAENEPLILKVREWNDHAAEALAGVATACVATELGMTYDEADDLGGGIEAAFRNPAMPTLAQQTDSSVKIASVVDGFANTATFWEMNGMDKEQSERTQREVEAARADEAGIAAIGAIFGAEPAPEAGAEA